MQKDNVKDFIFRSLWINILKTFDAGKAIVAALAVGVLGYFANLLTSLYSFVYWNSYFECYGLPIQYFERAINSVSVFYGFVVAVPIAVIYLILQIKYNNMVYTALEKSSRLHKKANPFSRKMLKASRYFAMLSIFLWLDFFVLVILDGGNDFILSMVFSSAIMVIVITLACAVISPRNAAQDADSNTPSGGNIAHISLEAILIIGITVFILSLFFVYLLGYFQNIILFDIPQVITVESDESFREYGMLLETDSSYICVPISYEEGREYIMNVQNSSYHVIPKGEIVSVSKSKAFMMHHDNRTGILFEFIEYDENAYWKLLSGTVIFSAVLLYAEYLALIKKRK